MSQKNAKYRKDYQAPKFTIDTVNLVVELDKTQTRITNTMKIKRQGDHRDALVLDGEHIALEKVVLNDQTLNASDYAVTDSTLTVEVEQNEFTLTVVNTLDPSTNKALEGLYLAEGTFCTQCEAEGFRRITYYLDRPDVLATFTTKVIAPNGDYPHILANGNSIERGEEAGKPFVTWHDPYPKPSYLFALVCGDFDLLEDTFVTREGREVALQLFVDKGNLDRSEHAMVSLKNAMRWDEERFGLVYDLDIYMIVAVDFFNMGAMENKGLNVFNSKYVLANPKTGTDQDFLNIESVIGHEYFHNWTGNRITCRDWFQLSLKEGLTVFRDQEFSSDLGSRAVNRIQNVKVIRSHQFTEDAGPMAHPIRPDKVVEMNNFYTVTVYNKGAEVIRMMHTLLGEAGFQRGMQLYVERHDGAAVTCEDFVKAMEDANQRDLSVFRRWYEQAGTPSVEVETAFDTEKQQLVINTRQTVPATPGQAEKRPMHIPMRVSAYAPKGERIALAENLLELTEERQTFYINGEFAKQLAPGEAPIVSVFDDFSAPVKVQRNLPEQAMLTLMAHADDPVSRWDAAQQLFTRRVVDAVKSQSTVDVDQALVDACERLITSDTDPALIALTLTLPNAATVGEYFDTIQIDTIVHNLRQLKRQLAEQLHGTMSARYAAIYDELQQRDYRLAGEDIALRQLQNVLLGYLTVAGDNYVNLSQTQFDNATNMTDRLAALQASVWGNASNSTTLVEAFDKQWRGDKLVMDKWFQTQALADTDGTIANIKALMKHPDFSLDNPNRIYSLLAAFTQNSARFHQFDGAGYTLIGDVICQLNDKNPQVASRLISSFMSWKRYDAERQALMKQQLEKIQALPNLASDLQEKIENSLAA